MRDDHPLARFAAATAARPDAVRRVRSRLGAEEAEPAVVLRSLPSVAPGAAVRVRARLARRERRSLAPVLSGLLLVGAAMLFVLRLPAPAPETLSATLDAPTAWESIAPTPKVHLDFQGAGALGGDARSPRIAWESGVLRVEVEPKQGIDLSVQTREADIRVVGTGFSVTRDALGTVVSVTHGQVAVLCVDGGKALLGAGESRTCAPTQPAALLGRARALGERGATADEVLAAADAGLAAGATGPVRSELMLARVESLSRLGRTEEALAEAEKALAESPARPAELHHLAARNALITSGCDAALPHLRPLIDDGASGPELVQYADCVATSNPEAARLALTEALRQGAPPDQEVAIVDRLGRLAGSAD